MAFAGGKMDLIWINLFKRNFLSLIGNNNEEKYNRNTCSYCYWVYVAFTDDGEDLSNYLGFAKKANNSLELVRMKLRSI